MALLVIISFVIISELSITKENQKNANVGFVEGLIPPIIIFVVNKVIEFTALRLVKWERHTTFGKSQVVVAAHRLAACSHSLAIVNRG